MKEWCYIKLEGGHQFVYMPDGTKIPAQVKTIVIDEVEKVAKAHVTLFVNIYNEEDNGTQEKS